MALALYERLINNCCVKFVALRDIFIIFAVSFADVWQNEARAIEPLLIFTPMKPKWDASQNRALDIIRAQDVKRILGNLSQSK